MNVIYNPKGRAGEYSKWALNVYNGCTNGCVYCYVPDIQNKSYTQFKMTGIPRKYLLNNLELDLKNHGSKIDSPVLLCFTCDAYQAIEETELLTRKCLEKFIEYKVPVQILTKGTHLAVRDFDLLSQDERNKFATTLTHTDNTVLERVEPGASTYESRVAALTKAKEMGIFTWVSLEPVIAAEETLKIIELTHSVVDHFKVGKLNHDPYANQIDWASFKARAVELLKKHEKDYYIKKDLDVF